MCTTSLSIRDFPLNIQRWFVGFETLGWEEDENKQIGGFEYESITAEEIHDSRDGFAKSKGRVGKIRRYPISKKALLKWRTPCTAIFP